MDESVKWRAAPTLPIVQVDDTLEVYIAPTLKLLLRAATATINRYSKLE
jgi:hypothetical protein